MMSQWVGYQGFSCSVLLPDVSYHLNSGIVQECGAVVASYALMNARTLSQHLSIFSIYYLYYHNPPKQLSQEMVCGLVGTQQGGCGLMLVSIVFFRQCRSPESTLRVKRYPDRIAQSLSIV